MKAILHPDPTRGSAKRGGAGRLAGLLTAALLLSACQSNDVVTHSLPEDGYRTKYPIVLAEGAETLDIPVGLGSAGLQASTRDNIRAFAADAAEKGTGNMVILTPSGSANEVAAGYVTRQIRSEAAAGGLPNALVEVRTYRVDDPNASAPIRLAYSRIKALSPPCGQWTGHVLSTQSQGDGVEFGCSTQANLAAMVSNPNDLITPRAQTPLPAWRRTVAIGKYGRGESPSGTYTQSAGSTSGN